MSDPCQCIFDHEAAMRRLINWLRENGEETNTDLLPNTSAPTETNTFVMWTLLWGVIALLMFFSRPNSLRSQPREPTGKPGPRDDDNNPHPPPDVL